MKTTLTDPSLPPDMAAKIKAALPLISESGRLIYDRKEQKIYRFRVEQAQLVAKTYQIKTPSRFVAAHLGFSRARRSFRAGLFLSAAGIRTARPLLLQEKGRFLYSSSVLVTEFCKGLSLEFLLASGQPLPPHLAENIVKVRLKLKNRRIQHGDFHALNIIISPSGLPWLIDLDGTCRCYRKKKADQKHREDLKRLLQSLRKYPDFRNTLEEKFHEISNSPTSPREAPYPVVSFRKLERAHQVETDKPNSKAGNEMKKRNALFLKRKNRKRIAEKWEDDRKNLPLEQEHKPLYYAIHEMFLREMVKFPDLTNPRGFNDKIQWLKLFDQDPKIIRCSDKLGIRGYVKERIGGGHLPALYTTASSFGEIDFSSLPESFVLKTNHDSGSVILVKKKHSFNQKPARKKLNKSLTRTYGWEKGEWAYSFIKPIIFAEEFIGAPLQGTPPPDYKFHCSNGRVKWLQYIYDREESPKEVIITREGTPLDIHFDHNMSHSMDFTPPSEWESLIETAEALASGFKYVRVDLYLTSGTIYIGELTFFPLKGCYKTPVQEELGLLLDFDLTTHKPPLAVNKGQRAATPSGR